MILSLPVYLIFVYLQQRKNNPKVYISLIFHGIFYIYVCYVIKYTLFPIPVNENYLSLVRPGTAFRQNINMQLLWLSDNFSFTKEHALNILMTIPFGFIINYLIKPRGFGRIILLGALVGICIECFQLSISVLLNYPYRIIDSNDVVMNLAGVVAGYLIFRVISSVYIRLADTLHMEHNSFTKYVYDCSKN
ncbi:VanZ family protein [Paenibacillus sp. FJAT-26967]|uniref:VanZ family protein n=1 Tax=Paenibacillus sp. FJAT-26967 TaxID=1729690 RepID=UPI003462D9D7